MQQYIKGEIILKGDFGIISQATDKSTGKLFCNKEIQLNGDAASIISKQEIQILNSLNHPNIVHYFGNFIEGDFLYIVLEYIEGESLRDFIGKQSSPPDESLVLSIAKQLSLAIQCCHEHNAIHCDLIPQNVFLTKNNVIKLIDFGLSCPVNYCLASYITTLHYMSP
jgi:serine/threonine protein kinase